MKPGLSIGASALEPECDATKGDHKWTEGGPRDSGRYHCSACMRCMYVPGIVSDMRQYRAALVVALTAAGKP